MTRNNADFAAGLFHGTTQQFGVGDIVLPSMYFKKNGDVAAYASDDPKIAKGFGRLKSQKEDFSDVNLYQVEPVDSESVSVRRVKQLHGIPSSTHYTSSKGFRVVKQVK